MIKSVLLMSGGPPLLGGTVFQNDRGVWNVTKAAADCRAGKFPLYELDVVEAVAANLPVEVDGKKVEEMTRSPAALKQPLIAVVEDDKLWLIDGHHRLRALAWLNVKKANCFIIPAEDEPKYRVLFNGQRLPPFVGVKS
jgi:hypothetical protein